MLAAWPHWVEGSTQRKVEGHQMFMGANDAVEVQTKLSEVEVFDGHLELRTTRGGEKTAVTY